MSRWASITPPVVGGDGTYDPEIDVQIDLDDRSHIRLDADGGVGEGTTIELNYEQTERLMANITKGLFYMEGMTNAREVPGD